MARTAKDVSQFTGHVVARLTAGVPTSYDPHEALKRILMADPLEKAMRRKWKKDTSNEYLRDGLLKLIFNKIVDQALYCEWRGKVVVPSRKTGSPTGRRGGPGNRVTVPKPDLPEFDPGNAIVFRWRKLYCLKDVEPAQHDIVKVRVALDEAAGDCSRALETARPDGVRGTKNTGKFEWDTPPEVLVLVREVLGTIDLDPASSKRAQKVVKAKRYYTIADNGLTKVWKGKVWLNPPYRQPDIDNFTDKMLAEVAVGNVTAAIMLTHNYTSSGWFQKLAAVTPAMHFPRGRINFLDYEGDKGSPTQGQTFFYFGPDVRRFKEVFASHGFVVIPA